MHELYELKDKLCRELKKYNNEEVTTNNLSVIDTLAHAVKNIDKIIDGYEEEDGGSYGYEPNYRMSNGRSYRGSNNSGSYSRGRGRNAKRDSMGRYSNDSGYSRHGDVVEQLREMMMEAPNDEIRRDYERVINRMESNM